MTTKIFNLIIIDESGSMTPSRLATIGGCNETLNVVRSVQARYADTQQHFVSVYLFQKDAGVPSRYIFNNVPVAEVADITADDYRPLGNTPMLDAIGTTLTDLKHTVAQHPGSIGAVTIITDGYENSSVNYSWPQVASMISSVKELGWNVAFIGANIDVDAVASRLNVTNATSYSSTAEGTSEMWQRESRSRSSYFDRIREAQEEMASSPCCAEPQQQEEARKSFFRRAAEDYFKD